MGGLGVAVRRHPAVSGVVVAYYVAFGVYGFGVGSRLTASYLLTIGVGFVGLAVAEGIVGFSRVVLVGLALWGAGHLAGGIVLLDGGDRILYNALFTRWIHFDNVVHFVAFGTSGLACWEALQRWLGPGARPSARMAVLTVAVLGSGIGALNEVVEFGISHAVAETQIGGYENTGRDLVANLLGGLAAGWIAARRRSVSP